MNHNDGFSLTTKRLVIGHVTVCQGCCCGNTANGRPPVPVDWLKKEWRARGLLKRVQLTISGCLGPCWRLSSASRREKPRPQEQEDHSRSRLTGNEIAQLSLRKVCSARKLVPSAFRRRNTPRYKGKRRPTPRQFFAALRLRPMIGPGLSWTPARLLSPRVFLLSTEG
jgi:hypothetical protein